MTAKCLNDLIREEVLCYEDTLPIVKETKINNKCTEYEEKENEKTNTTGKKHTQQECSKGRATVYPAARSSVAPEAKKIRKILELKKKRSYRSTFHPYGQICGHIHNHNRLYDNNHHHNFPRDRQHIEIGDNRVTHSVNSMIYHCDTTDKQLYDDDTYELTVEDRHNGYKHGRGFCDINTNTYQSPPRFSPPATVVSPLYIRNNLYWTNHQRRMEDFRNIYPLHHHQLGMPVKDARWHIHTY